MLFRIPLVGRIIRSLCLTRMFACLEALLTAKAPLPDAVRLSMGASGSRQWEGVSEQLGAMAAEGAPLEEVLRAAPDLPRETANYMALSQKTGRLAKGAREMLELTIAQVEAESDYLFMILFPAGVIAVGAVLLTAIVALVAPYFEFLSRL